MTRMRKERPTMRIEANASGVAMAAMVAAQDEIYENRPTFPGLVSFAIGLDPTTPEAFELWKRTATPAIVEFEPGTEPRIPISRPMPPIRCTMPVPCGVCWYCLQFTRSHHA